MDSGWSNSLNNNMEMEGKDMNCRLCNTKLEHLFVDLGYSPAANSFLTKEQLELPEMWYPLKVYVCHSCWLVQMDEYKPATEIFNEDYPYYSSHSENNVTRAKAYVEMVCEKFGYKKGHKVMEIGSNDGYLLKHFLNRGFSWSQVLGIEPSSGPAEKAKNNGVYTSINFFNKETAKQWKPADLICASNVLAHQPNLNDFLEGLRIALKPNGVITMEFPTVVNLLNGTCQFDTIYHEHFSYLSFTVVCDMFKRHGMEVFDVLHTPEQGGSIMVFAQHIGSPQYMTDAVRDLLLEESEMGITTLACYQGFQRKVEDVKHELLEFLIDHKMMGEAVAAYGASCKCNTLLNYCGVRPDLIPFVVDRSPLKQGKYLPGSHIPIVDEEYLKREKPDYVIITAWNLAEEIMKQLEYTREWECRFILTVPELEVL
jgi:SAM-dependent methyltransferase